MAHQFGDLISKIRLSKDPSKSLNALNSRALRAPFDLSKKKKFLGHCEPEFYNRSERSLMVIAYGIFGEGSQISR